MVPPGWNASGHSKAAVAATGRPERRVCRRLRSSTAVSESSPRLLNGWSSTMAAAGTASASTVASSRRTNATSAYAALDLRAARRSRTAASRPPAAVAAARGAHLRHEVLQQRRHRSAPEPTHQPPTSRSAPPRTWDDVPSLQEPDRGPAVPVAGDIAPDALAAVVPPSCRGRPCRPSFHAPQSTLTRAGPERTVARQAIEEGIGGDVIALARRAEHRRHRRVQDEEVGPVPGASQRLVQAPGAVGLEFDHAAPAARGVWRRSMPSSSAPAAMHHAAERPRIPGQRPPSGPPRPLPCRQSALNVAPATPLRPIATMTPRVGIGLRRGRPAAGRARLRRQANARRATQPLQPAGHAHAASPPHRCGFSAAPPDAEIPHGRCASLCHVAKRLRCLIEREVVHGSTGNTPESISRSTRVKISPTICGVSRALSLQSTMW